MSEEKKPSILLVEDEEKLAQFLEKGFKAEGFAIDIAADGETGLKYAFMNEYDIIFLDVNLPKMSGVTLVGANGARKDFFGNTQGLHATDPDDRNSPFARRRCNRGNGFFGLVG